MHFLKPLAVDRRVDHHRREDGRDRSRCQQDVDDQLARVRMAALRNGSEVPDHRSALVEIGGQDQQQASRRDTPPRAARPWRCRQSRRSCVAAARCPTTPSSASTVTIARDSKMSPASEFRIDPPQRRVMIAAEEGKRRRQGAGADAGDDVELRPVAALAPADQQPRPERAVVAAAGDHQKPQRPRCRARRDPPLLDLLCDCVDPRGIVHLEAGIGNVEDAGLLRLRRPLPRAIGGGPHSRPASMRRRCRARSRETPVSQTDYARTASMQRSCKFRRAPVIQAAGRATPSARLTPTEASSESG